MIASASVAHYGRRAPEFGVHVGNVSVNLAEVVARKNKLVLEWRQGQQEQVNKRPALDLYRGHGRFIGPYTIEVISQTLISKHIFIDTGRRPRVISIPGLDGVEYLTNRNIMDLGQFQKIIIRKTGCFWNWLAVAFD